MITMTRVTAAVAALLLAVVLIMSLPSDSEAIPAFARKYRMSCTTCHAPFPHLKDYGDEFMKDGFQLKDREAPRYYMETGDPHLNLLRDLPLAIRMDGFIQYRTGGDEDVDFTAPYALKLLSGAAITDHLAYYFYFYMNEHGEIAGVEDAYLMFDNLLNSGIDVQVGQFQVSDPLFKRELRLTFEDYEVYKVRPGDSRISLTYDRGFMVMYGFETGTDLTLEVLNGNGLGEADDNLTYDNDALKSLAGRISQNVGDYFRLGAFGYYGQEDGGADIENNDVYMIGPDATFSWKDRFALNAQYMYRKDDNPFFMVDPVEIESSGLLLEGLYTPDGEKSRWYLVGLYNLVDSDIDAGDYQSITGHIGFVVQTNVRLTIEETYDIEDKENRLVAGFIFAM